MSTKTHAKLTLLTVLSTALLVGCALAQSAPPTAVPPAPMTLTDSFGNEVHLTAPPTRIVSLAASNTEIVFAIGAGDRLVGRDEFSDFPAEALEVESIGSLYPKVNAEVVVALEPDLVLAAGITNPDDVTALAELGLTVYATSFAATI
ncbi:MAG TPA: ABC transporter substrate-binding protein, partial [Anaerolineales bacterium]|nr:ABC transporter substrate-binding protein [Anaerolineales bacterium]